MAVIVPPPQDPVRAGSVATTRPAGRLSVKPTPVSEDPALGLVRVKLRLLVPFRPMLVGKNDFAIVGGLGGVTTVRLAVAAGPAGASFEVMVLVVLAFRPAVVPVTLILIVQLSLPLTVRPVMAKLPEPATAVTLPLKHRLES